MSKHINFLPQYGLLRREGREAVQWGNSETTAFSQLLASLRTEQATHLTLCLKTWVKDRWGFSVFIGNHISNIWFEKKAFVVVCPYMYAFVCVSMLPMPSFRSRSSYTGCFFLMIRFWLLPVCVILKISTCDFLQIVEEEC